MTAASALQDLFAWPWLLCALPLPWLLRVLLPPVRPQVPALRVPYRGLDALAASGARPGARRPWLLWLGWCLLCIAAARPLQWGEPVEPPTAARDLMLAVDLSASMTEEDMLIGRRTVDRLTAAKAVIADFLERRAGDRIGLIVFGQRAFAMTPMTRDRDSVRQQLDSTVAGLAGQQTAIGDAIGLAVKRMADAPDGQRVLVLLTDGVNNAGALSPDKAAALARDAGVRVYTIAFGSDAVPGGLFDMLMPGSDPAIDEAVLRRIADTTGGRAFRARETAELVDIYAEIDRLEPIEQPGPSMRPRIERYPWPLAAGCVLLLLSTLPWRRLRRRL